MFQDYSAEVFGKYKDRDDMKFDANMLKRFKNTCWFLALFKIPQPIRKLEAAESLLTAPESNYPSDLMSSRPEVENDELVIVTVVEDRKIFVERLGVGQISFSAWKVSKKKKALRRASSLCRVWDAM